MSRDSDYAVAGGTRFRERQTHVPVSNQQHECRCVPPPVNDVSLSVPCGRRRFDQGIEFAVTPRNHLERHVGGDPYEWAGLRWSRREG